jgi:hypothetical protein
MANETKIALATRLASLYSKATQETVNPVVLLNNRNEYNRIVEKSLASENDELIAAALDCADAEGFLCAVYWFSGRKVSSVAALSEAQWEALKNSAINVAGPIGVLVVHQVKDAETVTDWASAVNEVAKALGSVGVKFRADVEKITVAH